MPDEPQDQGASKPVPASAGETPLQQSSRFVSQTGGQTNQVTMPPPPPPPPFFPELEPKPVTPQQAQQIFDRLAAMPDIAFGFSKDGCYARAHLMAMRLIEMGQTPSKAWGFEGDNSRLTVRARDGTTTNWWYHVAPTLPVQMPDGSIQHMVIDPSMFNGPTTLSRWGEMMNAPQSRLSVRGLNEQLPDHMGDYTPGTRTTPETTAQAEQTMQEYLQQQRPGPRNVFACDLNGCVNVASLTAEERDVLSHQPARRFEVKTGITSIAGDYQLPNGMNAAQFEDHFNWQFLGDRTVPPPALAEKGLMTSATSPELNLDVLKTAPPEVGQFYRQTWDHLVELNPILKDVKLDRTNLVEVNHAISGVSSGFNTNDINFYLERNRGGASAKGYFEDPRFKWIAAESGERPTWIASPETLTTITNSVAEAKGLAPLYVDTSKFTGVGNAGAASIGLVMGGMGLKDAIERGDAVGGALAGTNVVTSLVQATEGIAAAAGKTIPALTSAGKFIPVVNIAVTVADAAYQISKEDTAQHMTERGVVVGTTATTGIVLGATAAASTGEAAAITTVVTGALGTGVAGTGAAAVTVAAAPVVLTVAAVTMVAITGDAALKAKRAWDDVDNTIAQNGAAQRREGYKAEDGKPSVLGYKHIAVALLNHSENMKNENMNGAGALERDARGRFKINDFKKIDLRDPKNVVELERVLQACIRKQDEILKTNSNFLDSVLPKWAAHGGDTLDKISMAQMERADLAGAMQELQMYKKDMKDWDAAHPDNPATTGVKPAVPNQKPRAGSPVPV